MATSGGIPGGDKGEVHTEPPQPMDLAHGHGHATHSIHSNHAHIVRTAVPGPGTSVVQLRPIRTFTTGPPGTLVGTKGGAVGVTTITGGQPSIFVNRTGPNLTILPARARTPTGQIGVGSIGTATSGHSNISTLQFTRGTILSNVRPAVAGQGQSGSITVTPISASNFGGSIRLSAGAPTNNGGWIQAGGQPTFRPTTIQLTNRGINPDSKIIHIPQQGSLQPLTTLTQLQVVDNKGSLLKPMLANTPIVLRGSLQPNTSGGLTSPLTQYGIRATTIRPVTSIVATSATTSQVQKVITQPAHGPPIIVNANANQKLPPHSIQTISSMPARLPMFTLSTNGKSTTITPNSSIITVGPRQGGATNLIMGSAGLTTTSGSPVIKAYPISRDVNTSIVESIINQGHVHTSQHQINSPTLTVTVSGSNTPSTLVTSHGSHVLHSGAIITSTSANSFGNPGIQTQNYGIRAVTIPHSHQQQHQLVHVHGPINVSTSAGTVLPVQSMSTNLGSYYIEPKTMNVSILPAQGSVVGTQVRPIALDTKRTTINLAIPSSGSDGKGSLVTGSMILTNSAQAFPQSQGTVSIPIGAHAFTHPIPMAHQQSTLVSQGQAQFQHGQHLITTSQPQAITLSKSSSNVIPQAHTLNLNSAINASGQPVTHSIGGHIITVTPHITIPTQVMSSQSVSHPSSVTMSSSTTTTSLSSLITTSGATGPTTNLVTVSVNNSTGSSSGSVTSTTTSSTMPSASTAGTSAGNSSTTTSTPSQSPSQSTKSNLSPRPSILRKREAAAMANSGNPGVGSDTYTVPFRAQRNLAINFTGNSSSTTLSGLPTIGVNISGTSISSGTPSVTISTVVSTAANKENNLSAITVSPLTMTSIGQLGGGAQITPVMGGGGSSSSISILKKEFQPPNEESSCQSCSSNSSSGSTTLSATSETAEIQLQQESANNMSGLNLGGLHSLNSSLSGLSSLPNLSVHSTSSSAPTSLTLSGIGIGRGQSNLTVNSLNQHNLGPPMISVGNAHNNGMFRLTRANPPSSTNTSNSTPMGPSIRHRTTSVNKTGSLERGKGRGGKEVVSPRKKPRKQQLTISDFIESASPEISFYQGKRFKRSDQFDDSASTGKPDSKPEGLLALPEPPPQHVVYHLNKPHVSLLASNKAAITKVRANHFIRYDDVTTKDEKRPTINDLANQKNVLDKISGWKLHHLSNQMSEVIDSEMNIVETFNNLLGDMDARAGLDSSNRDLSRIEDLLKGNIQRCRVIRDQITESKNQVIKVLDHQPRIVDVINKYISKRPIKKRERL